MPLRSSFSFRQQLARAAWQLTHTLLIRYSPRPCHAWRAMVLRWWGAKVGADCQIYPRVIIWAPWNLVCGEGVSVGDDAEIYNVAPITLGKHAVISQGAYLCAASHDYTKDEFPLVTAPIQIGEKAWVAARAIVLMGVTIGEGCVVGAGSVVTHDLPAFAVCAGNPCRVLRENYRDDSNRVSVPKEVKPAKGADRD